MKKKTLTELYYECKRNVERKEIIERITEENELFRKQLAKDPFSALVRFGPTPIPPIPKTFQGKV